MSRGMAGSGSAPMRKVGGGAWVESLDRGEESDRGGGVEPLFGFASEWACEVFVDAVEATYEGSLFVGLAGSVVVEEAAGVVAVGGEGVACGVTDVGDVERGHGEVPAGAGGAASGTRDGWDLGEQGGEAAQRSHRMILPHTPPDPVPAPDGRDRAWRTAHGRVFLTGAEQLGLECR